MSMRVLFNGATLVRPGGASRIDASAFSNAGVAGVGVVGLVGECEGSQPGVVQIFTDPDLAKKTFRDGDLADAVGLAFNPMKDPRVPGGANAIVCIRTNQGAQSSIALKSGGTTLATVQSKDYGAHTNRISLNIAQSGGGYVVTVKFVDGQNITTETSPIVGSTAEMQIRYVGVGSACALTIDATGLRTTVTGAAADNLNIGLSSFATLADLIAYIDANPAYTCTAVTLNPYTLGLKDLDFVSGQDIRTANYNVNGILFRITDWINANSSLVKASLPTPITLRAAPDQIVTTNLTGGTRGISANTDFQAALDLLKKLRVNQVVPLISHDLVGDGLGSTAAAQTTIINADQHSAYMTSTVGKSERHTFAGLNGTKSALLGFASASLNSFNTCLCGQQPTVIDASGNLVTLPEWALAVIAAGARAGSDLGEPITWKYLNIYGITQDASWDPVANGDEMVLGGMLIVEQVPGKGFRFVKGVTTYTKSDNDAYTEESVVQGWKAVSYDFRTYLEDLFVGRKMSIQQVSAIRQAADAKLSQFRDAGQIVDSVVDGVTTRAYRKLTVSGSRDTVKVSAEISPVEGINFMLDSLYLVPATFSV